MDKNLNIRIAHAAVVLAETNKQKVDEGILALAAKCNARKVRVGKKVN